ncbi:MAG: hypothetical protein R3Y35_12975 [Clostridia bacterium]
MKNLSIIFGTFVFISTFIIWFDTNNIGVLALFLFAIIIFSTIIIVPTTFLSFLITNIKNFRQNKRFNKKSSIPFIIVIISLAISFCISNIMISVQNNNQMRLREEYVSIILSDDEILSNSTYTLPEEYASTSITGQIEITNVEDILIIYFQTAGSLTTEEEGIGYIQGDDFEKYVSNMFVLEKVKNYEGWYRFNSTLK